MSETRTVHFTLGENAGALLAQIAQEHLIYNHDPKKALATITESLIGIPTHLALRILKGELVLTVSEDGREFLAGPYDPEIHKGIFSRLNCREFTMRKLREITETGKRLPENLDYITNRMRYRQSISVELPFEHILDFVSGNEATVLRDLRDNDEIGQIELLILASKRFIESANADLAVIHFMKLMWPEEFESWKDDLDYRMYHSSSKDWLEKVGDALGRMFRCDFVRETVHDDVKAYIDAALAIDEKLKDGLEPVDIMSNYSAGWLSPEGEYYALNGEIANMLHNQIADDLYKQEIVPQSEENKGNPDNWLQANGWVRIHGNEINFEAHMNERINRGKNRFMTDKQVDMITEYCRLHHNGVVKVFFQPVSALTFQRLAKDAPDHFYEKYLNW